MCYCTEEINEKQIINLSWADFGPRKENEDLTH